MPRHDDKEKEIDSAIGKFPFTTQENHNSEDDWDFLELEYNPKKLEEKESQCL